MTHLLCSQVNNNAKRKGHWTHSRLESHPAGMAAAGVVRKDILRSLAMPPALERWVGGSGTASTAASAQSWSQ